MKTVFSNSDLVHTFAQRSQSEGRTTTNGMFFRDDKIYSYGYHYLLGEFIDDKTIIINDRGYSSSTGKHIGMLRNATRQYRQLFTTDIDINLVSWRIEENAEKLKTARKPEKYVTEILKSFETLESYLVEFKQVNIIKSNIFKSIKKIYKALYKDRDMYIKLAKARVIKEREQAKKKHQDQLKKFYNFEIDRIYNAKVEEDFLRVSKDRTCVETTQSVSIGIEDAIALYRMIKAGVNIEGQRIGNYRVNGINTHLMIGCHRINLKSVTTVGELLLSKS
jgi:hypothetical protein